MRFGTGLAVGMLATWRVSHLVAREDGPFDVVLRTRERAGASMIGRMMDCPHCVSVWAALPLAGWLVLGSDRSKRHRAWRDVVPVWLALSAGACLIERSIFDEPLTSAGYEFVDEEGR